MPILSVTYASSPSVDLLIPTLEFNNETAGVIRLAQSFNDVTATTELAETVTFIQSAWEVSLPNKDATGQQTLQFQICNVTDEAATLAPTHLRTSQTLNHSIQFVLVLVVLTPELLPLLLLSVLARQVADI